MVTRHESLEAAEKTILNGNKESVDLFRSTLPAVCRDADFVADNAADLVQLVFQTLPYYTSMDAQRAVLHFLQQTMYHESFMKAVAGAIVRQNSSKLPRQHAYVLLRWSCLVVSHLQLPGAKKAVQKLAECQAEYLDCLVRSSFRWHSAARIIHGCWQRSSDLLAIYLDVMVAHSSAGLTRAVLEYAASHQDIMQQHRPSFQKTFCDKVLGAREPLSEENVLAYKPWAQAISQEEFEASLLPVILRMSKRSPESVVRSSANLLGMLKLDLSSCALTIVKEMLGMIRHAKETVRVSAVEVVKALAEKTGSAEVLAEMLDTLCKVLDGSIEGKVRSASERLGLVSAIAALSYANQSANGQSAQKACEFLCAYSREEANEEVKFRSVTALGSWLLCLDSWSQMTLQKIGEGLKEKDVVRRLYLRVLNQGIEKNKNLSRGAASLGKPLAKITMDGVSKPAQRGDAVSALTAAATLASADSAVDGDLDSEKVWQEIKKGETAFLSATAAARLPAEEASCSANLIQQLLTHYANIRGGKIGSLQHPEKLSEGAEGSRTRAIQLLAVLMLHHVPAVRRAATAVASCAQLNPWHTEILGALQYWLRTDPPRPILTDPTLEDPAVSDHATAQKYHRAVASLAAAPKDRKLDPLFLARLLQIAVHPLVALGGMSYRSSWAAIRRLLPASDLLTAESVDSILDHLFGEEGIASDCRKEARAAIRAIGCLCQEDAELVAPALKPRIEELLDRQHSEALSPAELRIFQTPEGQIALQVDVTTIGDNGVPVSIPVANGLTKANGISKTGRLTARNGLPSHRPAAPALPTKAQPGKAGVKDKALLRQEKQLQEEAVVRLRVKEVQKTLEKGLHALTATALGDQGWTLGQIDYLEGLVQPLLHSPLVGEGAAFQAQEAIARSLPGVLGQQSLAVAAALRAVELYRSGSQQDAAPVPEHPAIVQTVQAMSSVTAGRKPLPLPAFKLCFPILAAVLSWPEVSALHDPALTVVGLHVKPGLDVPRVQMLELLYRVLGTIPAYRGKVQDMVNELSGGLKEEDMMAAFQGLLAMEPHVRAVAIGGLPRVPQLQSGQSPHDAELVAILWLAQHDPDPANAEAALDLWEDCSCHLSAASLTAIHKYLCSEHADVRQAAAEALGFGLQDVPLAREHVLSDLLTQYESVSSWESRSGTALALQSCAAAMQSEDVTVALNFLMGRGVVDNNEDVRSKMLDAGMSLVDAHGAEDSVQMLSLFESYLEKQAVEDEAIYDRVRQGAVVFMGTLARHMDPGSPKVKGILETLMDVLRTPSAEVQKAVAACLPPLMPLLRSDRQYLDDLIKRLLDRLLKGKSYGDRKGAAYGLAGMVSGLKISAINGFGILDALKASLEDKDANTREGSLLAIDCLVSTLGRLFEPYVVQMIGMLLDRFGDGAPFVRDANDQAAQSMMANLSSSGVKLVLPALLAGVDSKAWRSKQGSVQMLGAMAYLAPQPLSTALPRVVPKLSQTLSDPHPKVQSAARQALKEVGGVIRNPEIKKLVPALFSAIADPDKNAKKALDMLLNTTFVNTVDAASLALIIPVVQKSLRDRSGEAKKRASRIVGSMCTLINDPKDMAPYVPVLIPDLQQSLIDPLPEVRATAAKAMGSLLKGMGEHHSQDLMPWLLQTLKSEGSSVERSGAAQGLAEVLAVLGREYMTGLLPDILQSCTSKNPFVREGHLTLFKFLPGALSEMFQELLPEVLPAILDGLADESEGVRNAALAAGHTFVNMYATTALPLLLPAVEAGIVNDNWRIRQSSVDLLGDLLFKVAGTSGKVRLDENEEEGLSTEAHGAAIIEALGLSRRNQILAKVYLARSDVGFSVRSAAVHVWKTLVTNTPRTLSEILPCLMDNIIELLASEGEEQQQMAGACLGELVRKMGDRVLRQIIPIFQAGIKEPAAATRVGVCTGLTELLENISNTQLKEHLSQLLPTIQKALVDPDADVRQAAGSAFAILFRGGGGSAVDSVVPSMLTSLTNDTKQAGQALEGLRVILSVRPQTLGIMLPRLLKPNVTPTSMRALAALAEVAGPSIHSYLHTVMPPLLLVASNPESSDAERLASEEALRNVAGAIGEEGVYLLIGELEKALEDPLRRVAAANCLKKFCETSKLDFQEHVSSLITNLVSLMSEEDEAALKACWGALGAIVGSLAKELLASYSRCLRDALATAKEKQRRKRKPGDLLVPGLCLPKILGPILPIYLQGVLQGSSAELRETAAEGLGELVDATSDEALRPYVVQITGPLIRIIGDRFPWEIKAAILGTLCLLIQKSGTGLKPFVPQLQTTFLKCLPDQARQVRETAAKSLGRLSAMSVRVDTLTNDLVKNCQEVASGVKDSYLTALKGVLSNSGQRLTPATLLAAGKALQALLRTAGEDEGLIVGASACLGEFSRHCTLADFSDLLQEGALVQCSGNSFARLASALTLASVSSCAPARLEEAGLTRRVVTTVVELARSDSTPVKEAVCRAAGHLALAEGKGDLPPNSAIASLVPLFVALMGADQASDVQRQQLHVLRSLAFHNKGTLAMHYGELVPSLCSLLSAGSGPTKLATERTLARVLGAADSLDSAQNYLATPGPGVTTARSILSETYLRRLSKLPLDDAEDKSFD